MKRGVDERDEKGRWQRKQQQCSYATINNKGKGATMCLSPQQEVAAGQLTWWRWLRNGGGGSNDDDNTETMAMQKQG